MPEQRYLEARARRLTDSDGEELDRGRDGNRMNPDGASSGRGIVMYRDPVI